MLKRVQIQTYAVQKLIAASRLPGCVRVRVADDGGLGKKARRESCLQRGAEDYDTPGSSAAHSERSKMVRDSHLLDSAEDETQRGYCYWHLRNSYCRSNRNLAAVAGYDDVRCCQGTLDGLEAGAANSVRLVTSYVSATRSYPYNEYIVAMGSKGEQKTRLRRDSNEGASTC